MKQRKGYTKIVEGRQYFAVCFTDLSGKRREIVRKLPDGDEGELYKTALLADLDREYPYKYKPSPTSERRIGSRTAKEKELARNARLKRTYNLSLYRYRLMADKQGGVC